MKEVKEIEFSKAGNKTNTLVSKVADKNTQRRLSRRPAGELSKHRKVAPQPDAATPHPESPQPDVLDIFSKESLLEGCLPIDVSAITQKIFSFVTDKQVTRAKPSVLIAKADILKDVEVRGDESEFNPFISSINELSGDHVLLVYDADLKFGQNFVIVLSDSSRKAILNPVELIDDRFSMASLEDDADSKAIGASEDTDDEAFGEASDSVAVFQPRKTRHWINLGSDREVFDSIAVETRPKIHAIFQRSRREFGAPLILTDKNAAEQNMVCSISPSYEKAQEIDIMEVDKSICNAQTTSDCGTNTDWKYPRNNFTQYAPRICSPDDLQTLCSSNGNLDLTKHYSLFEQGLLQNMMYDFLHSDIENLALGDDTYDTRADNTFKEFLSFTDLKFSKDKAVTAIQWHPSIKGIVAMSVGERTTFEQKCEHISRILLTPTHIILWSFADPIQPQLILEAPEDILCFQFNPTDPHIVAGGCVNGMVVLWDIEKHMEDLRTVKARMKSKNKASLFSFDDTDPNRVPISPYCAVSNIEASHQSPVMDLQWVPDHMEVTRLGYCMENPLLKCVQLITSGLNDEILFWDTRPERSPLAVDKSKDTVIARNVPTTFLQLDMKWKPLLRVHLFRSEAGNDHAPTKFCIREVQGDRRLLNLTPEDKANMANSKLATGKTKPLQGASSMMYVGTEDGDLVYVDWMPHKDQDTGKLQTPKPQFYVGHHDGPIIFLDRSPFDPSVLLVVGGWTWSIWKEGVNSGPILDAGHSAKPLTGGCWSPTRPSVFFICRVDGTLEAWDLLDKTHEPAMIQSVSANAITALSLCTFSKRQIIAIGDIQGALQLFLVPRRLRLIMPQELANFNAYIDREVNRRAYVLTRWGLREQERIEQEAMKKKQAGIAPAVTLSEEEILQKEENRLPPEVNRALLVKNLPYNISAEEMYDIFGKYGALRQVRIGNTPETKGTGLVIYEDIFDAKNACDHLSGFNVCNRYLVVLYYQRHKQFKKSDVDKKKEELDRLKAKYGLNTPKAK